MPLSRSKIPMPSPFPRGCVRQEVQLLPVGSPLLGCDVVMARYVAIDIKHHETQPSRFVVVSVAIFVLRLLLPLILYCKLHTWRWHILDGMSEKTRFIHFVFYS
jgi:hypothetical protein